MSRTDPSALYLAQLTTARPLYRHLVGRALSLLPPVELSVGSERLVCFDSMAKLARALSVGRTTVRTDLERLANYQWLSVEDDAYLLGRRESGALYLLADLAAMSATGAQRLVSRRALAGVLPVPAQEGGPSRSAPVRRGAGRRWSNG